MSDGFILGLSNIPMFGLVLAAVVANMFPFVPEELFLLGIGYTYAKTDFLSAYLFVWLGLLLADTIVYWISKSGYKLADVIMNKVIGDKKKVISGKDYIYKRMPYIILISRFLVNIRVLGPILSGVVKFPYSKFIKYDMIALAIYVPIMLWLGMYFRGTAEKIFTGSNAVGNIVFISLLSILSLVIVARMRKRIIDMITQKSSNRFRHILGFFRLNNKEMD